MADSDSKLYVPPLVTTPVNSIRTQGWNHFGASRTFQSQTGAVLRPRRKRLTVK